MLTAWEKGQSAALSYIPQNANPFDYQSNSWHEWNCGWCVGTSSFDRTIVIQNMPQHTED